jgi:hypothetical protein
MNKFLRLVGTAVVVVVAIRILDWVLTPALPILMAILVMGLVFYVAVNGRRGL